MFVACLAYFFARDNGACKKRLYNDFFGGLFHDLPEAVTRDIISPVKMSSHEFHELIKNIETELSDREILPMIDEKWRKEIIYFTRDEFTNKIINKKTKGHISIDEINQKYNTDEFSPVDGELIRAADHLAAYLEAWSSINMGIKPEELVNSVVGMQKKYSGKKLGNSDIGLLFKGFESIPS
jgi:putative hydrolase of HD superfamily